MSSLTHRVVEAWNELRRSWDDFRELEERRSLLERPWQEEVVHWSFDGERWHLHGHLLPSRDGGRASRTSVTTRGWCPGLLADPERRRCSPSR